MTIPTAIVFITLALHSSTAPESFLALSGTWTLSPPKPGESPAVIEGRGNLRSGQLRVGPTVTPLVILQRGDKIQIQEHRSSIDERLGPMVRLNTKEYGLNGQPVKSPFVLSTDAGIFAVSSEVTSQWQENKLVSTINVLAPGEDVPRQYIETMSIGPGGILAVRLQRTGSSDSRTLFYKKSK